MKQDRSIKYYKGYKYILAENYHFITDIRPTRPLEVKTKWGQVIGQLMPSGQGILYAGYAWNGASGPTIDTLSTMRLSAEHDFKYQLVQMGLLDAKWLPIADRELESRGIEDAKWKWAGKFRFGYWKDFLKWFGTQGRPSSAPRIYVAP